MYDNVSDIYGDRGYIYVCGCLSNLVFTLILMNKRSSLEVTIAGVCILYYKGCTIQTHIPLDM